MLSEKGIDFRYKKARFHGLFMQEKPKIIVNFDFALNLAEA